MLAEKQEVARRFTMTRRVDNYYCGITPLDGRYVLRSEDTDRKQQVDLINAAMRCNHSSSPLANCETEKINGDRSVVPRGP